MKKSIFIFSVIATLFSLTVNAQASASTDKSATATLNVNLYPVQSIVVNSLQKKVDLDYNTTTAYKYGVASLQEDHLEVYSVGGFAVSVASSDNLTNGDDNIPSSDIKITPSEGTIKPLAGAKLSFTGVELSTTAQKIISSDLGANNATFNIEYGAKGNNEYFARYKKSDSPTVYTTTVTYTIAAQ